MPRSAGRRSSSTASVGSRIPIKRGSWESWRLARATGSRLVLGSAFSDLHPYREQIQGSAREDLISLERVADEVLMRAAAQVEGDSQIETVARHGDPAEVLADAAEEGAPD
jgi:nucleotide-binding universal stress UspA family protein